MATATASYEHDLLNLAAALLLEAERAEQHGHADLARLFRKVSQVATDRAIDLSNDDAGAGAVT